MNCVKLLSWYFTSRLTAGFQRSACPYVRCFLLNWIGWKSLHKTNSNVRSQVSTNVGLAGNEQSNMARIANAGLCKGVIVITRVAVLNCQTFSDSDLVTVTVHWPVNSVETLRAERFLDSSGACKKDDHLTPLSFGKWWQFLGGTLFLFFTGLLMLASFKIEGEAASEEFGTQSSFGWTKIVLQLSFRVI